jgi:hypothetical protein
LGLHYWTRQRLHLQSIPVSLCLLSEPPAALKL